MANGIYESFGSIRTTTVSGSSWTGLQAPDGSINVVVDDATHYGLYHPCGAWRISSLAGIGYDPSGAYYLATLLGNVGLPPAPTGFVYLHGSDGSYLRAANGALLLAPSGLVGVWSFDTLAALDTSGNANNGTAVNSPTVVAGQVGTALSFTGTNYVQVPNSALYNFTSGGYSYTFWVKGTAGAQPGFQGFISKGGASNDFGLSREASTTALALFHGGTGTDFALGTHTSLLNGSWNHCAITYDGTTATLYINSVSQGTIVIGAPTYTAGFPLYLGAARAAGVPFVGLMDSVKLWNRKLSSTEVTYDYNAGVAGNP